MDDSQRRRSDVWLSIKYTRFSPGSVLLTSKSNLESRTAHSIWLAKETLPQLLLRDVELDLKIELGRTQMHLDEVLRLKRGSVVSLDKLAGDPVDVYVNGRLVARGEVLVLNDNFCVRVAELISGNDVN